MAASSPLPVPANVPPEVLRETVAPEADLPQDVARRIRAFLRDSRVGQIVLNVNDGEVSSAQFNEYVRVTKRP